MCACVRAGVPVVWDRVRSGCVCVRVCVCPPVSTSKTQRRMFLTRCQIFGMDLRVFLETSRHVSDRSHLCVIGGDTIMLK